ncbi:ImmA/IrrE family metallo-endopeptidase [Tissierella praeacuta]|uniref:ImmA/IrrE family metallo-endopeptidase n=1 Tax=Tissierella praeacuta TaxID=43131 RepID=UPI0028ACFE71|nr:ImmA/IrrE family metallo-endopeptidase [Tissierella praeacuta]
MSRIKLSQSTKDKIEAFSLEILYYLENEYKKNIYNSNAFEMISYLNKKNIIIRYPTSIDTVSGLYYNLYGYRCIYVNSNHLLCRQYFSCWHEYFHSTRNKQDNLELEELEADYFASCMLLPREDIKTYFRKLRISYNDLDEINLIRMQHYFKVSISALAYRLNEIYDTNKFGQYIRYRDIKLNEELIDKTKGIEVESDCIKMELLYPTNDFVTSKNILETIIYLVENDKISTDKANYIYNFINDKGVQFLW